MRAGHWTIAALLLGLAGCGDKRERGVRHVERYENHVCSIQCHDHYYDERRVTYVKVDRHRHGPGCGHEWDGDRWRATRPVARPRGHVCTMDCRDHYYREGRVVVEKGHVHGRGCGHRYDGNRWVSSGRVQRQERPERSDRSDRSDRSGRLERSERR